MSTVSWGDLGWGEREMGRGFGSLGSPDQGSWRLWSGSQCLQGSQVTQKGGPDHRGSAGCTWAGGRSGQSGRRLYTCVGPTSTVSGIWALV